MDMNDLHSLLRSRNKRTDCLCFIPVVIDCKAAKVLALWSYWHEGGEREVLKVLQLAIEEHLFITNVL